MRVDTGPRSSFASPILSRIIKREQLLEERQFTQELTKTILPAMLVKSDGSPADVLVPPMEQPVDPYENATRPFDPNAAVAFAFSFVQDYLAATGNITGTPDSSTGIFLEFPQVITLLVNQMFQAARGDKTSLKTFPLPYAFHLQAVQQKVGIEFEERRISCVFVEVPPDHTEAITGLVTQNIRNAKLLDGEGGSADALDTGGFRPMETSVITYDADKAATIYTEMCSYLSHKMVDLAKPCRLAGMDPTTTMDAFSLNVPVLITAYLGTLDEKSYQYRKPPKLPTLALAHYVQRSATIDEQEDSRDFESAALIGGTLTSMYQTILYSTLFKDKAVPNISKEKLVPVPIMFNDILKNVVAFMAKGFKAQKDLGVVVNLPNALDIAVSVYNTLMAYFWTTTRAFSGVALPRAPTTIPSNFHSFIQTDATNCPSEGSKRGAFFYEIAEALRSLNALVSEIGPDGSAIRRVPAIWQTYQFIPQDFVYSEFKKHDIFLPDVPVDASSKRLWGQWISDTNRWNGGAVEPVDINLTDSSYVSDALIRVSAAYQQLKSSCPITTSTPASHSITMARWLRVLNVSGLDKTIEPEYGAEWFFGDGVIYTSHKPKSTLGKGIDESTTALIEIYILPTLPQGLYTGTRVASYNMMLGLPVAINRHAGATAINLRTESLADQCTGNGVVAAAESSELDASFFAGRIMHAVGGGFQIYKSSDEPDDWTWLKDLPEDGFVKELIEEGRKRGLRERVLNRLAAVVSTGKAKAIILRHIKARNTGKRAVNFIKKAAKFIINGLATFAKAIA